MFKLSFIPILLLLLLAFTTKLCVPLTCLECTQYTDRSDDYCFEENDKVLCETTGGCYRIYYEEINNIVRGCTDNIDFCRNVTGVAKHCDVCNNIDFCNRNDVPATETVGEDFTTVEKKIEVVIHGFNDRISNTKNLVDLLNTSELDNRRLFNVNMSSERVANMKLGNKRTSKRVNNLNDELNDGKNEAIDAQKSRHRAKNVTYNLIPCYVCKSDESSEISGCTGTFRLNRNCIANFACAIVVKFTQEYSLIERGCLNEKNEAYCDDLRKDSNVVMCNTCKTPLCNGELLDLYEIAVQDGSRPWKFLIGQ